MSIGPLIVAAYATIILGDYVQYKGYRIACLY